MIKPEVVSPSDEVSTVSYFCSTPLVVKGRTWLPLTPLVFSQSDGQGCQKTPPQPGHRRKLGDWGAHHDRDLRLGMVP